MYTGACTIRLFDMMWVPITAVSFFPLCTCIEAGISPMHFSCPPQLRLLFTGLLVSFHHKFSGSDIFRIQKINKYQSIIARWWVRVYHIGQTCPTRRVAARCRGTRHAFHAAYSFPADPHEAVLSVFLRKRPGKDFRGECFVRSRI